jgi:hypothetical protein
VPDRFQDGGHLLLVLGRPQEADEAALRFILRVAKDSLCAAVPGHHDALQGRTNDGVVG